MSAATPRAQEPVIECWSVLDAAAAIDGDAVGLVRVASRGDLVAARR